MFRFATSLALALFLICSISFADTTAKSLYDQGKFQDALETLQKNGLHSAADFFDAGNCYYKMGKTGQALGYFEKAQALAPNDDDIGYNIKLTSRALETSGALPKDQTFWFGSIVPFARKIPEVFADLLMALCTAALALSAHRAKKRRVPFFRAILDPAFLMVFAVWAFSGALATVTLVAHQARLAAIVADVAVGRSGPKDTFTELFKVPAGTTVELTGESIDGWSQIRFSLGNVGWVMEKDLLTL